MILKFVLLAYATLVVAQNGVTQIVRETSCPTLPTRNPPYVNTCATRATSSDRFDIGSVCEISCANGYPSPATVKTCTAPAYDGDRARWTKAVLPKCRDGQCTTIEAEDGETVSCEYTPTSNGDTCTIACDSANGYVGADLIRTCKGGSWSTTTGEHPTCYLGGCEALRATSFENSCTGDYQANGDTCNLNCAAGHAGASVSRTCTNGVWSDADPTCYENGCAPYVASAGTVVVATCESDYTANGGVCVLSCPDGYIAASISRTCVNGAWSDSAEPVCLPAPQGPCAPVSSTTYESSCSDPQEGDTCVLSCVTGYQGDSINRTCLADGWDNDDEPTCQATTCGPFADGADYSSSCAAGDTTSGSTCTLECNDGFSGTPTVLSCFEGDWDHEHTPVCAADPCPAFTIYGNIEATCSAGTTASGGICTLSCLSGYTGQDVVLNCLAGSWDTTTEPVCVDVDDCASAPCLNDGVCYDGINAFSCVCAAGWLGDVCEHPESPCDYEVCAAYATCEVTGTADTEGRTPYNCTCNEGYAGDGLTACADIDECALGLDNCHSDAYCTNTVGGFDCSCLPGFAGVGTVCTLYDSGTGSGTTAFALSKIEAESEITSVVAYVAVAVPVAAAAIIAFVTFRTGRATDRAYQQVPMEI